MILFLILFFLNNAIWLIFGPKKEKTYKLDIEVKKVNVFGKLQVYGDCYFLTENKIYSAIIIEKTISFRKNSFGEQISVRYTIDHNSAGSQYKTTFTDGELFATKEDLLNSL